MLAFGHTPFEGKTLEKLKESILNKTYNNVYSFMNRLTFPDDTDKDLMDFIAGCL